MKRMIIVGIFLCILLVWANVMVTPATRQVSADEGFFVKKGQERAVPDHYNVPVLLYHHISEIQDNCTGSEKFVKDMKEIKEAGYETVLFEDLYRYVHYGEPLPEKPLVITFDDGYLSNYKIVYPLLKQFGQKAEISLIGNLVGGCYGEDNWPEKLEYFSWSQAKEMEDSGTVRFQNHTYNMHHSYISKEVDMLDCIRRPDQSFQEYQNHFTNDHQQMLDLFFKELESRPLALIYPLGHYDEDTEALASQLGYAITATTEMGVNRIALGEAESLRRLKRIGCDNVQGSVVELLEFYGSVE